MQTKRLLNIGILIPMLFWASTIISGFIHGNYNHLSNTVIQLGAIGARSELIMNLFTWLISLLSLFFMAGLWKACRQLNLNVLPIIGVLGFTIMFGWAATFHSGNKLHSAMGPVVLLLDAGTLLVIILWKGEQFRQVRLLSFWSLVIMLLIFLRFIPGFNNRFPGLIQRFAHLGWSVWFIVLCTCLKKAIDISVQKHAPTAPTRN